MLVTLYNTHDAKSNHTQITFCAQHRKITFTDMSEITSFFFSFLTLKNAYFIHFFLFWYQEAVEFLDCTSS